jgi:DNA-binding IclR family transcriptional regulator
LDNGRTPRHSAVLTLGFEYLGSLDLLELAAPLLAQLRDHTGHSVHLAVRNRTQAIYLARYESRAPISSSIRAGTSLPAHATGRVMLADLTQQELAALDGDQPLEPFSQQTPATLDALQMLLATDREHRTRSKRPRSASASMNKRSAQR